MMRSVSRIKKGAGCNKVTYSDMVVKTPSNKNAARRFSELMFDLIKKRNFKYD